MGGLGLSGDPRTVRLEGWVVKRKNTRCCGWVRARAARCGGFGDFAQSASNPRSGLGFPRWGGIGPRSWGGLSTAGNGVVHGEYIEQVSGSWLRGDGFRGSVWPGPGVWPLGLAVRSRLAPFWRPARRRVGWRLARPPFWRKSHPWTLVASRMPRSGESGVVRAQGYSDPRSMNCRDLNPTGVR